MSYKGEFVHLHVHTEFSLLDGSSRVEDLLDRTKELGMDTIAITDHGGLCLVSLNFTKKLVVEGSNPY